MTVGIFWKVNVNFFETTGLTTNLTQNSKSPARKTLRTGLFLRFIQQRGTSPVDAKPPLPYQQLEHWYHLFDIYSLQHSQMTSHLSLQSTEKPLEVLLGWPCGDMGEIKISPSALPLHMQRSHQTPFPQLHPPQQGLSPLVDTWLQVIGLLPT